MDEDTEIQIWTSHTAKLSQNTIQRLKKKKKKKIPPLRVTLNPLCWEICEGYSLFLVLSLQF